MIAIIFVLLNIIIITSNPPASIVAQSNNESDKLEGTENVSQINIPVNSIITWFLGGSGIATFLWGVYEYRKNRILKRQEILFDLIEEFDRRSETEPTKIKIAKDLLDDLTIDENLYNQWKSMKPEHSKDLEPRGYYHISNMGRILKYHGKRNDDDYNAIDGIIIDYGERIIRECFDELLNYFGKLGYLLDRELIKKNEIKYFDYYIKKAVQNEAVMRYARLYEFENFGLLLFGMEPFSSNLLDTKLISNGKTLKWINEQGKIKHYSKLNILQRRLGKDK